MKTKDKIHLFLLGMACFVVSQILLRLPLLNLLESNFEFQRFKLFYPVSYILFLAFSAGLFEEGFRYLFRKYLVKTDFGNNGGLVFGFGHGMVEVIFIFINAFMASAYLSKGNILIMTYERILAVVFHISMTILIWSGFRIGQAKRNLFIAIICHGIFNSLAIFISQSGLGLLWTYIILTLYCLILVICVRMQSTIKEEKF